MASLIKTVGFPTEKCTYTSNFKHNFKELQTFKGLEVLGKNIVQPGFLYLAAVRSYFKTCLGCHLSLSSEINFLKNVLFHSN